MPEDPDKDGKSSDAESQDAESQDAESQDAESQDGKGRGPNPPRRGGRGAWGEGSPQDGGVWGGRPPEGKSSPQDGGVWGGRPPEANTAAARLWAATRFPYLASGVFGAQVIAEPGSGTVAVDEGWRLRADPELTAAWTPAQLGSVLIHHVCHLLRTHGERARAAGPDEARTWIRAADAEINDDLVPAGLELPGRPVLPEDLGAPDGLLAEQYFEGIRGGPRPPGAGARAGVREIAGPVRPNLDRGKRRDRGLTAEAAPTGSPGPGTARAGCRAGRRSCSGGRSRRT